MQLITSQPQFSKTVLRHLHCITWSGHSVCGVLAATLGVCVRVRGSGVWEAAFSGRSPGKPHAQGAPRPMDTQAGVDQSSFPLHRLSHSVAKLSLPQFFSCIHSTNIHCTSVMLWQWSEYKLYPLWNSYQRGPLGWNWALVSGCPWQRKWSESCSSCPTLCNPMDYTVHGILQASILECVVVPFSRESSQPRDWTQVSSLQMDSSPTELPGKPWQRKERGFSGVGISERTE